MCWKVEYIFLIIFSTLVDYLVGLKLGNTRSSGYRKVLLALSLTVNLGLLVTYKYADFIGETVQVLFDSVNIFLDVPGFNLMLPVGISFYTFQSLSYTIDVYRGHTPVERHLGIFSVYVAFFPQLVAGPIERSGKLLPQFKEEHRVEYHRFSDGTQLVLWGLFKKLVIADLIAPIVDTVYSNPGNFTGGFCLLATFFFAVQIYCDFSGYTDIAIGVAKMFGFDLMTNFKQPYFSTSISEFWSRWHISLSTWFRDYVYIPLGGNRVSLVRHLSNVLIVFTVSGLWHGASWTFVIWGAIHGMLLITEVLLGRCFTGRFGALKSFQKSLGVQVLRSLLVFFFVLIAWVFFRANSVDDAIYIVSSFADLGGFSMQTLWALGLPRFELVVALFMIGLLFVVDLVLRFRTTFLFRAWQKPSVRWILMMACLYCIVFFGVFDGVEFIYFDF
jgi:alginate O-acetyltransferase complex protein AlgI